MDSSDVMRQCPRKLQSRLCLSFFGVGRKISLASSLELWYSVHVHDSVPRVSPQNIQP